MRKMYEIEVIDDLGIESFTKGKCYRVYDADAELDEFEQVPSERFVRDDFGKIVVLSKLKSMVKIKEVKEPYVKRMVLLCELIKFMIDMGCKGWLEYCTEFEGLTRWMEKLIRFVMGFMLVLIWPMFCILVGICLGTVESWKSFVDWIRQSVLELGPKI